MSYLTLKLLFQIPWQLLFCGRPFHVQWAPPRSQYGMDVDQEYCVLCQVRHNTLSQTNRKHLCPINEHVFVWYRMVCRAEAALSWHAKRKFSVCQILALLMTEFPVKSFQWHLLIFLRKSTKQQPHASPASIATTRAILPRTVRMSGENIKNIFKWRISKILRTIM